MDVRLKKNSKSFRSWGVIIQWRIITEREWILAYIFRVPYVPRCARLTESTYLPSHRRGKYDEVKRAHWGPFHDGRRFRWASNPAFQQRRTKLKRHWKIAQSCCSSTVPARLRYHVSSSVVFVHHTGTLAKGHPLSKLQNCCHLKKEKTSTWFVMLAWSMPTKSY